MSSILQRITFGIRPRHVVLLVALFCIPAKENVKHAQVLKMKTLLHTVSQRPDGQKAIENQWMISFLEKQFYLKIMT